MRIRLSVGFARAARCALAVVLPLVLGCASSTELTGVWSEPGYSGGSVDSVLVVAFRKDPMRRRLWEDGFVRSLADRGVRATPSYTLFPGDPPDTQQVIQVVRENGYRGILSLMRLADQSRTVTEPGYMRKESVLAQDWAGRYFTFYRDVYEPGDTTTVQLFNFESDLWRVGEGSGRMVWSAIVRVSESASGRVVEDAIRSGFMPRLTAAGMVPKKAARP